MREWVVGTVGMGWKTRVVGRVVGKGSDEGLWDGDVGRGSGLRGWAESVGSGIWERDEGENCGKKLMAWAELRGWAAGMGWE